MNRINQSKKIGNRATSQLTWFFSNSTVRNIQILQLPHTANPPLHVSTFNPKSKVCPALHLYNKAESHRAHTSQKQCCNFQGWSDSNASSLVDIWCMGGHYHKKCQQNNNSTLPTCCNYNAHHPSSYNGCSSQIRGQKSKEQQSAPRTPADHSLVPSMVTAGKLYPTIAPATANPETTNVCSPIKVTQPAPSKRTDGEMLILQPTFQQAMRGLWTIKTAICSTNI